MCLGIPAKIISVVNPDLGLVEADSDGVSREINISMLLMNNQSIETLMGKWVLLHVGFAMAVIDEQEALQTLALLKSAEEASDV